MFSIKTLTFYVRPVIAHRRFILNQFLALVLIILLLPIGTVLSGNRREFQAAAQAQVSIVPCDGTGSTRIIRKPCADGASPQEIVAFETDVVNTWLAAHQLPQDDTVYKYGRLNLRNELRGFLVASIVAIIQKPASQRTPREQAVYTWMQANVKKLELQLYQEAIAEWNAYNADRCYYRLDPDIVSTYGISYDPRPFCYPNALASLFTFPATPAPDYFLAVGLKKSYGAALAAGNQQGTAISYALANDISTVRVLSSAAGLASGLAAGGAVAATAASLFPLSVGLPATVAAGISSATPASLAAAAAAAPMITALTAASAGAVIALAVTIGIQAGIQAVNNQAQIDQLNSLSKTQQSMQASQPDLGEFLNSNQGRDKFNAAFVIQTLPDTPGTDSLPPHDPATDPNLAILPEGAAGVGTSSAEATFQDWNNIKVSITTRGGYFLQTIVSGGVPYVSITPTIHYLDWAGNQMTASRRGANFLVLRHGDAKQSCPADAITELTTQPAESCSTWLTDALQLLDKDRNKVTVRISSMPVFTSKNRFSTPVNTPATATVSVTSPGPLKEFKLVGAAPPGITVTPAGSNSFSVRFGSTAARGDTLTFSATNAFGTTTQNVVFTSYGQLQFTSIPTIEASSGSKVSYTVATNGASSAAITSAGLDQIGLTLTDNLDGTATVAGIVNWPSRGTTSASCELTDIDGLCPITLSATNGAQTITSHFPHKIPVVGISYESHQEKDLGYLSPGVPVSLPFSAGLFCGNCIVTLKGQLPAGLTLSQTAGNLSGVATLAGTPAFGSEGDYNVTILFGDWLDTLSLKFSVGELRAPVFTSPPVAIFTLTRPMPFTVSAVGIRAPKLVTPPLPEWLTFETQQQPNGVTGKLSLKLTNYIPPPGSVYFQASSEGGQNEQILNVYIRRVEGDLNNDGVADCVDYRFLKNVLRSQSIQPGYVWMADVNGDGYVNIEDLSGLGRLLPGNPVCR